MDIKEIANTAAGYLREGKEFKSAIYTALDQHSITGANRMNMFYLVCRELGARSAAKRRKKK